MRVSAKGEYATRAVLHLAMLHPDVVTIHEIAARNRIPVKYLEQILLELRRAGLIVSRRGVHGGYKLTRHPSQISIGDVLRVADPRVTDPSRGQCDSDRGYVCTDSDNRGLKRVWSDVQLAVEKILFETTIADVCARSQGASLPRTESRVYEFQV